jgi:hypothetical protein
MPVAGRCGFLASDFNPACICYYILRNKEAMTKRLKKFLWTPPFWALIGLFGCGSGLYFQRLAGNGLGLWFLGLVFLGAAYLERAQ